MKSVERAPAGETLGEFSWNIAGIVSQLRELRDAALAARQRLGHPAKLPARKTLAAIVEDLCAALFPNRLGSRVLVDESLDYFVGRTLDAALRELVEQVARDLQFGRPAADEPLRPQAIEIVRDFADLLPQIRALLESDILAAYEGDPAARNVDEVLACYPGITAIAHYRLAHALWGLVRAAGRPHHRRSGPLADRCRHSSRRRIGGSFFIDHGTGVVIGETAIIGQRVRLYHGVTLGAKRFAVDEDGVLVKGNARHPIVEDDVVIYAGATILGRVTIGRGSVIGGNVWLTRSVPPGSKISQAQVRSEQFDAGSGI